MFLGILKAMRIVLSYSSYFMLFYIPIFTTHVSASPTNPTPVLYELLASRFQCQPLYCTYMSSSLLCSLINAIYPNSANSELGPLLPLIGSSRIATFWCFGRDSFIDPLSVVYNLFFLTGIDQRIHKKHHQGRSLFASFIFLFAPFVSWASSCSVSLLACLPLILRISNNTPPAPCVLRWLKATTD